MSLDQLPSISRQIWEQKYRFTSPDGPAEASVEASWRRVARAVAAAEAEPLRAETEARFYDALSSFEFLPAGRILSGAGTGRSVTLFNCFVMGAIEDDMASIFENVKEAALTMQQGGGIGHDFSTLRPKGALVHGVGADASGPVSFMDVWDAMCRTIMSAGSRRGAMMATLACDHPDIEAFIEAKSDPARLRNFNLSVLVSDAFMQAVEQDAPWELAFGGKVYRTLPARALWDKIMRSAYEFAEPGVIFIDRVNRENNLRYCETIHATNPCGEQPLPPYGACLLGSINLARLVRDPFTDAAALDEARLAELVAVAIRFLDNVVDVSNFPLEAQRREAQAKRRLGLGVTGLADALIFCRQRYGSAEAAALAERWMALIEAAAYRASAQLAAEKGAFPLYDAARFAEGTSYARLDAETKALIDAHGLRNGLLTSIAPTGTISLLAGNVSSGIEPVFDFTYDRRILAADGSTREEGVEDYAYAQFRRTFGPSAPLPDYFVATGALTPADHLRMQAALQRHVDASISKTVNCPEDLSFEAFKELYRDAFQLELKGCTAYRPNAITGSVLAVKPDAAPVEQASAPAAALLRADGGGGSADVVYMAKPLERDPVLAGNTYKLKWADSDHAIYVTINDIVQDGRRRPFEIFINSKNLEHYAWTVALTRMISAVFRRGGDVSFVVEELKAVFDPRGGQWMGGRYVPSLLAAIGAIIEQHMLSSGFLQAEGTEDTMQPARKMAVMGASGAKYCPRCGSAALHYSEGCLQCRDCGFSKCS
ncbi:MULTISPECIES: adenosylcobalamin-dependent ribonucleoside-diphosphate reductase [Rhodomicrobium]|uniref:adenosylcobalamin-dependent ribonucleoside-diphosphate reductase n=1 Tax=Rhodomicrobium TaxID=1068 RepID=UPI000B4A77D9|nr:MULTISPECIES: adenosylcobalamin-dependent ribonucleoside-diphosphate reductase [Rhodomicrobium]